MTEAFSFRFESKLLASRARVWEWMTSVRGISAEMWPLFRMTTPRRVKSLSDIQLRPGIPMFRSYVFLFGFLPIDYSDMTLLELTAGRGFVEQSPMGSMKVWRHEREIVPCLHDSAAVMLVDRLTFQPRMAKHLVGWLIHRAFVHRHKVLRAHFNGAQSGTQADLALKGVPGLN